MSIAFPTSDRPGRPLQPRHCLDDDEDPEVWPSDPWDDAAGRNDQALTIEEWRLLWA